MSLFDSIQRLDTAHRLMLVNPHDPNHETEFVAALKAGASAAAESPHRTLDDPAVADAWNLAAALSSLPAWEAGTPTSLRQLGASLGGSISACVLAQALLSRAWETDQIPRFNDLPEGIWGAYAGWVFAQPRSSLQDTDDQERMAKHLTLAAEELATWAGRNIGSGAVRSAIKVFLQAAPPRLELWPRELRPRWQTAKGRILNRWHTLPRTDRPETLARLPANRYPRIGIIGIASDDALEGFVRDSAVALLSDEHGEVIRFLPDPSADRDGVILPPELADKCRVLAEHALDIVIFVPDTSTWDDTLTGLATVRHAKLQIAIGQRTTGLPTIDVILTTPGADEAFTERPIVTPFEVLCNPLASDPSSRDPRQRAQFNIPSGAVVAVAPTDPSRIGATVRDALIKTLIENPHLHLVLAPVTPWSELAATAAQARWQAALPEPDGVSTRLTILPYSKDEPELLRPSLSSLADIWLELDLAGDLALIATAATHQVPFLVWTQGAPHGHRSAGLLRHTGMTSALVPDGERLISTLGRLAQEATVRQEEGRRLHHAFFDSQDLPDALAVAEVLGNAIENCRKSLTALDHETIEKEHSSRSTDESGLDLSELLATADAALGRGDADQAGEIARRALRVHPLSSDARFLMGRSLATRGHLPRAITYLTAAVYGHEHEGERWLELAKAFREGAELPHALDALGACLQVSPDCLEAWVMMVELARGAGSAEIAAEALAAAQHLAPDDPRVQKLALSPDAFDPASAVPADPFAAFAPPHG